MAKAMLIYLSDEEVRALEKFCRQNDCSQYAREDALKELLYRSTKGEENSEQKTPVERILVTAGQEVIDDIS